jgi:hypothetical protein
LIIIVAEFGALAATTGDVHALVKVWPGVRKENVSAPSKFQII